MSRSHLNQMWRERLAAMATLDIQSARALLLAAKKDRIVDIMLTQFEEEVKAFGRDSDCFDKSP